MKKLAVRERDDNIIVHMYYDILYTGRNTYLKCSITTISKPLCLLVESVRVSRPWSTMNKEYYSIYNIKYTVMYVMEYVMEYGMIDKNNEGPLPQK